MKTKTKDRIWTEVIQQLNSGKSSGKNFQLFFTEQGWPYIKIFTGHHWTLPKEIALQLTGTARAALTAERQKQREKSISTAAKLRAEREEREKRLDEPGFFLIAGEESKVLLSGTWRDCHENLWRVTAKGLPRDPYSGIGCWIIVKGDFEAESGKFDKDCYY